MTQTVTVMAATELQALKHLVEVDAPARGPFRGEDTEYLRSILMDNRRKLVRARLEQDQKLDMKELRDLGDDCSRFSERPIVDRDVDRIVHTEINMDLDRIKGWMEEDKDPVAEMHRFREK